MGHVRGQRNLGNCYLEGKGVYKDTSKAAYWLEKAADQNDEVAQYVIAQMYEYGDGKSRDLDKAYYWYERAADNGHPEAKKMIEKNERKAEKWAKDKSIFDLFKE